jgi:hypothetical protein
MLFQESSTSSSLPISLPNMLFTALLSAISLISVVAGHGAVTSYIIGGATYPGQVTPFSHRTQR